MSHITYLEAAVVGLVQGVTELFPVSSLGHNVLIPALVGGQLGQRPERGQAGVAVPGLHRRAARGHRAGPAGLLLAGLGPDHRRVLQLAPAAGRRPVAAAGHPGPEAGLDDHPGHDSGRHRRAAGRARVPGHLRPADRGRVLPDRQRGDPVLRGEVPHPPVGAGRPGRGRRASGTGSRNWCPAAAGPPGGQPAGQPTRRSPGGPPGGDSTGRAGRRAAGQDRLRRRPSSSARRRSWPCWPGSAGMASPWSPG